VTLLDAACANALARRPGSRNSNQALIAAYGRRSGFRALPEVMRGAARDFAIPDDMRTPKALRSLEAM
jgi:hypothetical protein